jgi:cbb3-type cytochrome c oxidase subunit III
VRGSRTRWWIGLVILAVAGCNKGRYDEYLNYGFTTADGPARIVSGPGDTATTGLGDRIFHGTEAGGTCYTCHGITGKGTSLGPDLTDNAWIQTDGSRNGIAGIVTYGVPAPLEHETPMPPLGGAPLTSEQVRAVAEYVYRLSHPPGEPGTRLAGMTPRVSHDSAEAIGDVSRGRRLFHGEEAGGTCFVCHGREGKGGALGPTLSDDFWLDTDGSQRGIAGVVEYGVAEPKQHGIVMPPMGGVRLDQDQIRALSAYVYSLSHTAKPR